MAAVALLNANGTRKMSVKSPNQPQQGQTVTVELDISDAYGTEFLVAVYDYANNVTTYRVEMDLGAMEREYFTAIDYNTMTYVGVDRAGQTSFLAETGLPLLARAAEYVGGHVFVITTDNSLCVADDENLSVTERICQLDPNRERLITGVNDLAYNHAVGRLYVQYYSELNREARPFLAAIDMDDGGLQDICELPVDVNTMAIDVAGGSKACYELGTFADGVWPVAGLMEPGEVQNHIGVIMPDQALATTSVPMNTATPPWSPSPAALSRATPSTPAPAARATWRTTPTRWATTGTAPTAAAATRSVRIPSWMCPTTASSSRASCGPWRTASPPAWVTAPSASPPSATAPRSSPSCTAPWLNNPETSL